MVVICGDLDDGLGGESPTIAVARRTAAAGAPVEIVGIMAGDAHGDARLLALATAGIGHAAVLRSPQRALERADVELALRYLPDVRVIVAVDLDLPALAAAADGAAFAGATLVVVTGDADAGMDEIPTSAVILAAPRTDPDGAFAGVVAGFAARMDAGATASDGWTATVGALAIDEVSRDRGRPGREGAR